MDDEGVLIKVKKKMITEDAANHIFLCGKVWRSYVAGHEVIVVTEHEVNPCDLFRDYLGVIQIGIDKGLVKMVTLSQVKAEHLNMCLVEF